MKSVLSAFFISISVATIVLLHQPSPTLVRAFVVTTTKSKRTKVSSDFFKNLSNRRVGVKMFGASSSNGGGAKLYASTTNKGSKQQQQRKERVAIIGGGIAGLSCGHFLSQSTKFEPTVFDTGRLRPGGRCSSRYPNDRPSDKTNNPSTFEVPKNLIIDHTAQILTVPNNGKGFRQFENQVKQWEEQNIIQQYKPNTVCNIMDNNGDNNDGFQLEPMNVAGSSPMYYGTNGMGSIPEAIHTGSSFDIEQDVWVSPSNGVKYQGNQNPPWLLQANGEQLGRFDRIIIAHNGKCADRIMSKTPAKQLHSLLCVNFAPTVPAWGGKKMTLNSIYSLSFKCPTREANEILKRALPANQFTCGFIQNEPSLRFLTCQSRKYKNDNNNNEEEEVWTLLSSPTFAKKNKAPQEFIPDDVIMKVSNQMIRGLEKSLHLSEGSLGDIGINKRTTLACSRLQLWGAGVPLNVWRSNDRQRRGFLYDGDHNVGVCGDWLLDASIGGAWESGRRLAQFMINTNGSESAGLEGRFQRLASTHKAGLGSFVATKENNNNERRNNDNRGNNGPSNNNNKSNNNRRRNNTNNTNNRKGSGSSGGGTKKKLVSQ